MSNRSATLGSRKRRQRQSQPEVILDADAPKKYVTKLHHPQYSIEQCPNCGFPESDGGFCQDCGWSKPPPVLQPANSVHGRLFAKG